MATEPKTTGLTYEDLQKFPDDHLRREIIDGDLVVTPSPVLRHQRAVRELIYLLVNYCRAHGGEIYPAPTDVFFSDTNVVVPDVLLVRADRLHRLKDDRYIEVAPDLVVEVSSPGTRRIDLGRRKDLYQRFGVPEYWFVDLEANRFEVYRLSSGRYGSAAFVGRGETVESPILPGLEIPVDDVLGPSES